MTDSSQSIPWVTFINESIRWLLIGDSFLFSDT